VFVCVCERERDTHTHTQKENVCKCRRRLLSSEKSNGNGAIKKAHRSEATSGCISLLVMGFVNPSINPAALHVWGKFRRSQHMVQVAGSFPIITTFMDNTTVCP